MAPFKHPQTPRSPSSPLPFPLLQHRLPLLSLCSLLLLWLPTLRPPGVSASEATGYLPDPGGPWLHDPDSLSSYRYSTPTHSHSHQQLPVQRGLHPPSSTYPSPTPSLLDLLDRSRTGSPTNNPNPPNPKIGKKPNKGKKPKKGKQPKQPKPSQAPPPPSTTKPPLASGQTITIGLPDQSLTILVISNKTASPPPSPTSASPPPLPHVKQPPHLPPPLPTQPSPTPPPLPLPACSVEHAEQMGKGSWELGSKIQRPYTLPCPLGIVDMDYASRAKDLNFLYQQWKPEVCTLKRWDPRAALRKLRGKAILVVGDSISNSNIYPALGCALFSAGAFQARLVAATNIKGLKVRPPGAELAATFSVPSFYVFFNAEFNVTVFGYWSPLLMRFLNTVPVKSSGQLIKVCLDEPDEWSLLLPQLDLVLLQSGAWWSGSRRFFDRNGTQVPMAKPDARKRTLEAVRASILSSQSRFGSPKEVLVFSRPVRHPSCMNTWPLTEQEMAPIYNASIKDWDIEYQVFGVLAPAVRMVDTRRMTTFRADAHPKTRVSQPGKGPDCLHWATPGLPDRWFDLVAAMLGWG